MFELIDNPHGWAVQGLIAKRQSLGWDCIWRENQGWAPTRRFARRKVLRWMYEEERDASK